VIKRKSKLQIDYSLLVLTLALLAFGLVSLYSASTVDSYKNFGNTSYYIKHQLMYGAIPGLIALYILSKIDYHLWLKLMPWIVGASLLLLALVKVPGLGFSSGGATRWLHLGSITFQPAELAKLAIIFYIAAWADRKQAALNDLYFGLLPTLCVVILYAVIILWQPDLGTMLVLIGIAGVMLFAAGINWRYLFWTAVAGTLSLYALIKLEPYRARRLTAFFDPEFDPKGIGYQIKQALLAIGAGGLWGYGYGLSRQKHNYLPEVMGDSIFAVTAEELGFFRILAILALFLLLALKGYSIAKKAPDNFGKLVAFGVTTWVILQALINIGAMVNLLPLTGIPLPFFSYGSSSLLVMLAAIGILMNVSRHSMTIKRP